MIYIYMPEEAQARDRHTCGEARERLRGKMAHAMHAMPCYEKDTAAAHPSICQNVLPFVKIV